MKSLATLALGSLIVTQALAADFAVQSPDIKPASTIGEEQVFNGFGCQGDNVSPALNWSGAPAGTQSYAVTVYDPDAPTGSGWWHWVVFNIPASAEGLRKGAGDAQGAALPAGSIQSRTDYGKPGYGGPCPPTGDKPHRYVFTVHALKVDKLPLDADSPAAMVGYFLNQNTLKKAVLSARYGR